MSNSTPDVEPATQPEAQPQPNDETRQPTAERRRRPSTRDGSGKKRKQKGNPFRVLLGFEDPGAAPVRVRDDLQLGDLLTRRRRARAQRSGYALIALVIGGAAALVASQVPGADGVVFAAYLAVYGLLALVVALVAHERLHDIDTQYRDRLDELDLRDVEVLSVQQRAEKLFKINSNELKRYYDQTLRHSSGIFWMGLVAIGGGLGIMFYTIHLVISYSSSSTNALQGKIIIAALGSLGTILVNFVAAIYLKMYASTRDAMTIFHNRLVLTNHLHFANLLGAQITDQALRENALATAMGAVTTPAMAALADGGSATSNGSSGAA